MNVKWCIVISSSLFWVSFFLEMIGLLVFFEGMIIISEEVENGKFVLDIFLFVVEKMGVLFEKCLVIEDFMVGIEGVLVVNM